MTPPKTSKPTTVLCSAGFIILCCAGPLRAQAVTTFCSPAPCRLGSALKLHFDQAPTGDIRNNAQTLELMLDGRRMNGLIASGPLQSDKVGGDASLSFDLNYQASNKDNKAAWNVFLTANRKGNVNLGLWLSGKAVDGVSTAAWFDVIPPWWPAIALVMAVLLVGFIVLAATTDVLRDGPQPPGGKKLSFSLGRTQMAWWTFIIACSFVYIWMVTWDWTFLPGSALVLIGISATTALGAQLVDGNRNQRRQALLDQQRTLLNRLDQINVGLRAAPANAADLQAERTQKQAQLDSVNSTLAQLPPDFGPSVNFLADILQDDEGVSLHRFQLFLWTLILGIVFIVQVLRSLAIPEFNDTLLALMGISAGTYVGFKIPDPPKQS
jgi:hypothetical protein